VRAQHRAVDLARVAHDRARPWQARRERLGREREVGREAPWPARLQGEERRVDLALARVERRAHVRARRGVHDPGEASRVGTPTSGSPPANASPLASASPMRSR